MRKIGFYILDIMIVFASFLLCVFIKPGEIDDYIYRHRQEIITILFIWMPVSYLFNKYKPVYETSLEKLLGPVFKANGFILGVLCVSMIASQSENFSRLIIFGTFIIATLTEIVLLNTVHYFKSLNAVLLDESFLLEEMKSKKEVSQVNLRDANQSPKIIDPEKLQKIEKLVSQETNHEVFEQLIKWENLCSPSCLILATTNPFNIEKEVSRSYDCFANLKRVNDIRFINKFFETVNGKLPYGGRFIGFVETDSLRKRRILLKFPPLINYLVYYIDFIIKRLLPKFKLTKGIYFALTRGKNRVISKAETFGRLYCCGFEIVDEVLVNKHLFFLARKVKEPTFDTSPTYGPIIKLKRIGKDGKIIDVYKFRTMHPYSEYLQEYIYKRSALQSGGKLKDDFRVTTLGRFFRKFWLDEIPMIINVLKGDLKLFGVRPLSRHYFSLYSKELQDKRIKHKPGLIPPFYSDLPETLDEIIDSEIKYLKSFDLEPFMTDMRYFFKAANNIIFNEARSK